MPCERSHCAKPGNYGLPHAKKKISFWTGLILALLPKCPFCVMAFSGTFVLCGEAGTFTTTHTYSSSITFLLAALFCGIAIAGILFNYRDSRTKYALLLALAGSSCILYSVTRGGGLALYYSGVLIIFSGVWLNGSLLFFIAIIRSLLNKHSGNKVVEFE